MRIIERFPLWLRITHWLNSVFLSIMLISGLMIYWANEAYPPFFPKAFYSFLGIDHSLALGMGWHFLFAWAFTINGILYVSGLLYSGEWRSLWPHLQDFPNSIRVTLHELGLRPDPGKDGPLNSAQKITYSAILIMGVFSVLTGLAIYKPKRLWWLTLMLGNYEFARLLHFIFAIAYCGFVILHVGQVIKAGWNSFRSMVAGFEIES